MVNSSAFLAGATSKGSFTASRILWVLQKFGKVGAGRAIASQRLRELPWPPIQP